MPFRPKKVAAWWKYCAWGLWALCALRIKVPYTKSKCESVTKLITQFFWGELSLPSDWEHWDDGYQPTVYRYDYRPTTSKIATVKQHKIKNSVANSLAVISTSFPRDLLTTDPQYIPFRPKKKGVVLPFYKWLLRWLFLGLWSQIGPIRSV